MTLKRKGDQLAMRTRMSIIASALVGVLALAAPAVAQQSPTQDAYGGGVAEGGTPHKPTTPQPPAQPPAGPPAPPHAPGQEPAGPPVGPAGAAPVFRPPAVPGLQVTLVLLAGAALLGGGLVLRRATSSD